MRKLELHTYITDNLTSELTNNYYEPRKGYVKQSRRSKLTLHKNLSTSKSSIVNKLIYSKKNTDIPSRYKDKEFTFEDNCYNQFKPNILCYNIETPYDERDYMINKKINTSEQSPSFSSNQIDILESDPNYNQYPDQSYKKNINEDNNRKQKKYQSKISRTRLLHSSLRPDTSNTSNLVLPDLQYTISTDKLPKPTYPKKTPPPVFKNVGSYKCKLPPMTSKERLLLSKKFLKEQKEFQKKESALSIDKSKSLKKKEDTQYDILFGIDDHLESDASDYDWNDLIESPNNSEIFKRLQTAFSSESDIDITKEELEEFEPYDKKPTHRKLFQDDEEEEFELKQEPEKKLKDAPEEELEIEPEETEMEQEQEQEKEFKDKEREEIELEKEAKVEELEEIELEQEPENEYMDEEPEEIELEQEPDKEYMEEEPDEIELEEEPEKKSKDEKLEEMELEQKPEKETKEEEFEEVLPMMENLEEESIVEIISVKESPIKPIIKKKSPEKIISAKKEPIRSNEVNKKPRTETKLPKSVDEWKTGIGKRPIIFKECDRPMCKYDKGPKNKECEHFMINVGISSKNKQRSVKCGEDVPSDGKAFQSNRESLNNNQISKPYANPRKPIDYYPEVIKEEPQTFARNSNKPKNNQRNRSTINRKKCEYNSREKLYEKELQSYNYLTNRVTQNYQNLKSTNYNLLLDLNFQNKPTQTRHSERKDKNMQTRNYFPSQENQRMSMTKRSDSSRNYPTTKNVIQVQNGKYYEVIRPSPLRVPQLVIITHPTRRQSQLPKPSIDIIYKNRKYLECPKYVKTNTPHKGSQRISVDNKNYSYNNNLAYNKNSRMFTYFVDVKKEPDDNFQHSLNLKTVDRNLNLKFV